MGVFRQFPYSNFHEMNMDEIIKVVKDMLEEWAQYYAQWDQWQDDIDQAWQDMQDFINNYFDNLDVQQEINNKIISMVNSGEFADIVSPYIPDEVTDWLAANITQPVGVVIDTSLSVSGACADAKATGDAINDVKHDIGESLTTVDKNTTLINSGYIVNNVITSDVDWRYSNILPIPTGAKRILFNLYGFYYGGSHVQNVTFYDEDVAYISYVGCDTSGGSFQNNYDGVAEVPSGAKYYQLCTKLSGINDNYIQIETALVDTEKAVSGFYKSETDLTIFTNNGYIVNNTFYADTAWRTTDFIELDDYASAVHFKLFGFYYGGDHVQNVTFYSNLKQPISYVGCDTSGSNFQQMYSASADIPQNAKYIRICTKYSNINETVFSVEYKSVEERLPKARLYSLQDAFLAWMNGDKFPVAFAGDSTTDGYGTTGHIDNTLGTDHIDTYAYPYLLQTKLREECNNNTLRIYNAGFTGKQIGYIIDNFEAEFGTGTPYEDTKMIGISFGINDRVDTAAEYGTFVNNIIKLCDLCYSHDMQPFMLTCQCTCESAEGVTPNRSEWENISYANKAKYEVAELLGLELIDIADATAHFIQYSNKPLGQIMNDLCHFGDGGHEFESGFIFSEIIPRTITAGWNMNLGFTSAGIKSDVVYADGNNTRLSILSTPQNGFKTKIASVTSLFTNDIVLLDAWIYIDGERPLTLTAYCDNPHTTHVLVDGVNTALTSTSQNLGTLDLGLHHIVAKSGTSNTVEFYGFTLTP